MTNSTRLFQPESDAKYLIYAEGKFGAGTSKTANVLLRYQPDKICAVVDSRYTDKTVRDVNSTIDSDIPVVSGIAAGLAYNPTHLIIGVAPSGGQLPEEWLEPLKEAITGGLHIVSGLHSFLCDNAELVNLAKEKDVQLIDLRKPPKIPEVSQGFWRERTVPVVQTIAPDCAFGKLTAAWELKRQFEQRDYSVGFVATGQTGILLNNGGIVVDAVPGDFISAAVEQLIRKELESDPDVIIVEGQGAIYHEGFSAVTLGILHGAMPDAFLFAHRPSCSANDYGFHFPPYRQMINDYERIIEWFKPVHTIGVQLDTSEFSDDTAHALCEDIGHHTGLPATDLVRFPDDSAVDTMIQKLHL
ncbi:MAG: DUF1611 domain-containing protein [Candidatus Marinimicrobia bacterium]|nr:DUF1611 domain-containing protein [Candidatus Neomarinimicrobiota bacterium]MCF7828219.1 DUF1611 domain-containing protein [Candidatus Neomarinimicrobiota bacterium]MCF7879606.1 DUF1611 domain-containing protein [Candidatus Neomarinimicrobiota bacterium]